MTPAPTHVAPAELKAQAAAHVCGHDSSLTRVSLADSGASYHIIDPIGLTKAEIKRATDLIELVNISCAGEPFGRDNR